MSSACFPPLASVEAVRPVFLIVMGVFILLVGWRLAQNSGKWTARMLMAGALLLGFGYALLMPMYEAGILRYYSPSARYDVDPGSVLGWHIVKLMAMNTGWLLFGIGVAMHAKILGSPSARAPRVGAGETILSPHESAA
jgi:hypothetical protein